MREEGSVLLAAVCSHHPGIRLAETRLLEEVFPDARVSAYSLGWAMLSDHSREPFDLILLSSDQIDITLREAVEAARNIASQTHVIIAAESRTLVFDGAQSLPCAIAERENGLREMLCALQSRRESDPDAAAPMLLMHDSGGRRRIPASDIRFIMASDHTLYCRTRSCGTLRMSMTMNEALRLLEPFGYIRTHRQYIVRIAEIRMMMPGERRAVMLYGGEQLPVSRGCVKAVMQAIDRHTRQVMRPDPFLVEQILESFTENCI